ncbi:YggS family pyridoxal phosphate-dependent enzyme [Desulfobulbus alkaliphilus]|uniref:YggS family pyridoxal phosphate-dependent enzyme n=1 Tax=Desulfobulbus alkaliphilus TaxID=869814 RepID=UPI0019625F6D|nr:YggS family pyridoxal phosphate-dependent enzyme [Desulfobulbus alkaliphilus]MBM9535739.1 YggS family pyridoxal phosphate-dependent enzyme [Desulfobulbus alkaliphilus]
MINDNLTMLRAAITQAALQAGRNPADIKLVAVSKQVSIEGIRRAIACGQTLFGENYLQEAVAKIPHCLGVTGWHFIGHLQSNKVAQVARFFDMVETVDRLKIAIALDKQVHLLNKNLSILIQINVGGEKQKSGISCDDAENLLRQIREKTDLPVRGLMTIPPFSPDPEHSRPYYRAVRDLARRFADRQLFSDNTNVELSMGMSGDFPVAIEEGATIIRVGTALFGTRQLKEMQ